MSIIIRNGKLLIRDNKLALDEACCCGCTPGDTVYCASLTLNNLQFRTIQCGLLGDPGYVNCITACQAIYDASPQAPEDLEAFEACVCQCEQDDCGEVGWVDYDDPTCASEMTLPQTIKAYWFYASSNPEYDDCASACAYDPGCIETSCSGIPELILDPLGTKYVYSCHCDNLCDCNDYDTWINECYGEGGFTIYDCYGCDVGTVGFGCDCIEGSTSLADILDNGRDCGDLTTAPGNITCSGAVPAWECFMDEILVTQGATDSTITCDFFIADVTLTFTSSSPDPETTIITLTDPMDPMSNLIPDPFPCFE